MTSPEAAPSFRAWSHAKPPFPESLSLLQQSPPKASQCPIQRRLLRPLTEPFSSPARRLETARNPRPGHHGRPQSRRCSTQEPAVRLDLSFQRRSGRCADARPNRVRLRSIFRLAALSYPKGLGCDFAGRILGKGTEIKDLPMGADVMGVTMSPVSPRRRHRYRLRC